MKDIRIFVASSEELKEERNYLAFLVLSMEEEFARRGLRVRLAKWEYVDPNLTKARTEDRYLDEMYNCDAALVLFRDIAGMYTREELDNALAAERTGLAPDSSKARLKTHQILFAADGKPDSDAAKLRAQMDEDGIDYHIWPGLDELRAEFLALVDRVAQCERLVDAPSDKYVRKITAFLAADEADEVLAKVRDAFADTVLNINDLLEQAHRNIRVQLNVYDPANAESVIQASEMGLVLYRTNYRVFGKEEVGRVYERVREKQNPKKFYVFFQTLDEATEKMLDEAFRTFRSDFVSKFGHFTCQFGDANALRLGFILSLERYAGKSVNDKEIFSTVEIPEPGKPFVGREEELRQLCGLFEPVAGKFPAGRLPVITGAGGTGKSELVRQYASQRRVQYAGGVFQVDMEHRRTWDEAFLGILDHSSDGVPVKAYLGLDKDKEPGGDDKKSDGGEESGTKEPMTGARVRDALLRKAREKGPILLVLDNVEGFEEMLGEDGSFAKAFPSSFSERVHVNIVATARTCDVPLGENDWAQVFPLGDLSLDAALELLFADKIAESEEEKKGAERVAELLGRRALFLRRVPGILKGMKKKSDLVCRTYAGLAKELEKDVLETIGKTGWVDPSYWPARLWVIVQGNLAEWGLGEACIKLVKIASFFSPDGFPEHILRHLWNELVYPGLENWGTQKDVFTEVVDLAKKYNLFQSVDPIRIHRLDRAAILQTARNEPGLEEAVGKSLAFYYGMSPEYWLLLTDNVGILQSIPKRTLLARFGSKTQILGKKAQVSLQVRLLSQNNSFQDACQWKKLNLVDWHWLFECLPQFADRCPWENLDGAGWVVLLGKRPQFADRCPWEKLNGRDWVDLLRHQPQFADRCLWEKIDGLHWQILLEDQPQFADRCPWEKLDGGDWAELLRHQPQFANQCPWEKLRPQDWVRLLSEQPQLSVHCHMEKFTELFWTYLLKCQPQFADRCPWEKLNGHRWEVLLCDQPQFADRCPWEKLDGGDWADLLRHQPQFADRCQWEKLNGHRWEILLCDQPLLADKCVWEELGGGDWASLLRKHPQFADRCPWEKLGGGDWASLLEKHPQFADRCLWEKLGGGDWASLLEKHPQFADRCPWEKLGGEDWASLLQKYPQFADRDPWEKFDGEDWSELLSSQPQFADKCIWEKLNGEDWSELLSSQPQFADRCMWEKLDGEDWAELLSNQPLFAMWFHKFAPRLGSRHCRKRGWRDIR